MHPDTLNTREQELKGNRFYRAKEERLNTGLDNPEDVATVADIACLMLGLYPNVEKPEEKITDPEDIVYCVNQALEQKDMSIKDGKKYVIHIVCESSAELLYLEQVAKYFISRYKETPLKDLMLLNEKMHIWSLETHTQISGLEGMLQFKKEKVHKAAQAAIECADKEDEADYFSRVTRPVPAYRPAATEECQPVASSQTPQGTIVGSPAKTTDELPKDKPAESSQASQAYIVGTPVRTTGELPRVDTKVLARKTRRTARDYVKAIVVPLVGITAALAGLYIVKHYVESYNADSVMQPADAAVAAYEEHPEQLVPITEKKIVPVSQVGNSLDAGFEDAGEPAPQEETVVKEKKPKTYYKLPYKFPKKARRYIIEKKE